MYVSSMKGRAGDKEMGAPLHWQQAARAVGQRAKLTGRSKEKPAVVARGLPRSWPVDQRSASGLDALSPPHALCATRVSSACGDRSVWLAVPCGVDVLGVSSTRSSDNGRGVWALYSRTGAAGAKAAARGGSRSRRRS